MGNFCFFIEKVQNLRYFVEITGFVKDGTIKIGDIVKYSGILGVYCWQVKEIRKDKHLIGEASAEDYVDLFFSISVYRDITNLRCLQKQILVGKNYNKPFISDKIVVSCENISVSVLKSARITFNTDILESLGMILSVQEKNGRCYAEIELLSPTYAKPDAKCVLIGEGWKCDALIKRSKH